MATTKSSSRSEIRTYQQSLNDAGAQPPLVVDGLWGPKTQAAHDEWGGAAEGTADTPDALVGTGPEDTEPRFGLAGGAELWKDTTTGESYIVYTVPGTEGDPVYMRWTVPSEADVQSFFGPGQPVIYQQEHASDDAVWGDTVDFGGSDDILNTSKSPFDSWASTLETESQSKPWILDADYQELLAMSIIEGREVSVSELQTTKWWKDHDASQRQWMQAQHGDPATAETLLNNGRLAVTDKLAQAGITGAPSELANFMADLATTGEWSIAELNRQIDLISDSYYAGEDLDPLLQTFMDEENITLDMNQDMENEVRNTVQQWLGTNFGNWDDALISEWAGKFRNEPDAREALTETLKDQKQALFPDYDREADYQAIASPWRNMMRNVWGEVPDDSDTQLHSIIRMNDAGQAGEYLTRTGLERENQTVVNSVQGALDSSFGGI